MSIDVEQALKEALELGEQGEWAQMAELLTGALKADSEEPYVLGWLGVAYRELGEDGAAYDYFKRAWQNDPLDAQLLALIGAGLAAFDDPEAEAALRAAALTGPNEPFARLQYGAYLAREGLFDQALDHLQAAVDLDPDDPVARGELGIAYALKGDHARATDHFEQTLDMVPEDSWTRVLLGLVQLEAGEDEVAAETLLKAAQERPEDAEAQILAALAAGSVGWEDAAIDVIARADYASEGVDQELLEEAREKLEDGNEATRAFLRDVLAPSALHDRLNQPI